MLRAAPLVPGGPAYQYKRGQILKLCSSWQLKHVADLDASLLFFTSSGRFLEACTFTHTVAYGGAAMHLSDNVSGVSHSTAAAGGGGGGGGRGHGRGDGRQRGRGDGRRVAVSTSGRERDCMSMLA